MAFNPNKKQDEQNTEQELDEMDKALKTSKKDIEFKQRRVHSILKPKVHEAKKRYNFTLKPSNHAKLKQLCEEYGYNSASELIDELIESL
ncbi:CopG family transcriptional regulator [Staphylococcus gallinarum]|uniref:CopG family transcriptional regulator n=1 Tax=Staphylococcus gallinarum TaxID=1293 RepID=UPI0031702DA6